MLSANLKYIFFFNKIYDLPYIVDIKNILQNGAPPYIFSKNLHQKSSMILIFSIRYKIYLDFSTILRDFGAILAILPGHRHLIASCRVRFTSLLVEYEPTIYCVDLPVRHSIDLIAPSDASTDGFIVLWDCF